MKTSRESGAAGKGRLARKQISPVVSYAVIALTIVLAVAIYMFTIRTPAGGKLPAGKTRQGMYAERARMMSRGGGKFDPKWRRTMLRQPPPAALPEAGGR